MKIDFLDNQGISKVNSLARADSACRNTSHFSTTLLYYICRRPSMDYFYKFRSTVTQVAAQVSNALPGNPVTREYDVGEQIASAGPGLYWKVFAGKKKSTQQPVAVWLFEKKEMEKWSKDEKENFVNIIKRGVSQLTRLRHPRLLVVEHSIEESRDSLAFCTEPIFASLANCLGKRDNLPSDSHLTDFTFHDVEIKHGLLQVAEALAFLHIDARMLHRNVCPESVVINDRGAWKLAGFDFAVQGAPAANNQVTFDNLEYNEGMMAVCQPLLEFLGPEYVLGGKIGPYADMFSLGITTFTIFNKGAPPVKYNGKMDNLKRNADKFKSVPETCMSNIPFAFRDDYKQCLNYTPDLRPDATQFTKIAYFDDPLVKTLVYFESLMQMDNQQKMNFFKSLPQVINRFEKRVLIQKVLPFLCGEFTTPDLIPFILPSIFIIIEQSTQKEFTISILPSLIPVFSVQKPYQIVLLLLQRMELLLAKATEEDVKKFVLPLVYNAIGSDTTRIQELCLSIIPSIGRLVDRQSMKTQLLPKLLKLATDGSVVAVRVQSLVCLGKLLPTLESWMVTEQVLPVLPRITSKEPGVLMSILGIYKLAFESEKVGVGREQLAKSALPFLMATLVENTLNLGQFEQFVTLVKAMLGRVEKEQRNRLEQLSAGEEAQRSVPSFDTVIASTSSAANDTVSADLSDLMGSNTMKKSVSTGGSLSLEEKKRLTAEQHRGPSDGVSFPLSSSTPFPTVPTMSTVPPPSSSLDPFDALLSFPSSSKPSQPSFDVSHFLNSTGVSPPQPSSSPFPSLVPPPSNASLSNPLFLPQPPRSTNAPIRVPTTSSTNSLDSLFSFPSSKPQPCLSSLAGIPPPPQSSISPSLQPLKPAVKSAPPSKDPFADLLG